MGVMEEVKDADWKSVPIYHESGTYAREHGELEQYRESNRANNICKQAIEQTIRKNFDGMRLLLVEDMAMDLAETLAGYG